MSQIEIHATTVIGVIRNGKAALGSDGQVTLGNTVMKSNAKKVRKLYNGQVIAGFAGSTSDALTLFEKFEAKLDEYRGPRLDRGGHPSEGTCGCRHAVEPHRRIRNPDVCIRVRTRCQDRRRVRRLLATHLRRHTLRTCRIKFPCHRRHP